MYHTDGSCISTKNNCWHAKLILIKCIALYFHTVYKNRSQYVYTTGDQSGLACDAIASVDFGAAFVDKAEKLTGGCRTGTRICKRQRIHYFQQGIHGYISY